MKQKKWWRNRWLRLIVPIAAAGAGVVLGLASNKLPKGFWQQGPQASPRYTWLIALAVVVGAVAVVFINGATFVAEYRTRNIDVETAISETLALVVGHVADRLQIRYIEAVRRLLSGTASPDDEHSLRNGDLEPISPSGLAAYFHAYSKPWLRKERLRRVQRFSAGRDLRETQKQEWFRGEGLLGTTWNEGFGGKLVGGLTDNFAPNIPVRAAVAYSVVGKGGEFVGVLSLTGPGNSLPKLYADEIEQVLGEYSGTIAQLATDFR